ncbi:MAG TPA: hypothetical protein VHT91_04640 [Kofleriaceae bacterium]|jgi:hypothetical protein|nr:hypothetical protein [Kofleriaceae bacterium]
MAASIAAAAGACNAQDVAVPEPIWQIFDLVLDLVLDVDLDRNVDFKPGAGQRRQEGRRQLGR